MPCKSESALQDDAIKYAAATSERADGKPIPKVFGYFFCVCQILLGF